MRCSVTFEGISSHLKGPCSFSHSAVKVHGSQAYRNRGMARERINFNFDPREIFPYWLSFVRATVACAILERTSGFEPSSETIAARYLKIVTVPSFCLLTLISVYMLLVLFVISLVFSALISVLYLVQVLLRLSTRLPVPTLLYQEHQWHRQTADW